MRPASLAALSVLSIAGGSLPSTRAESAYTALPESASLAERRYKPKKTTAQGGSPTTKMQSTAGLEAKKTATATVTTSKSAKPTHTATPEEYYASAADSVCSALQKSCATQQDALSAIRPLMSNFEAPGWAVEASRAITQFRNAPECSSHSPDEANKEQRALQETVDALDRQDADAIE